MPSDADKSAQEPAQGRSAERGRPFPRGTSGNPGGQPKWLRKLRKDLAAGSPDAAKLLLGLIRGDIRNVVRTEDGDLIEVDPHMKDRLKAAELWFAYMVPKPKQEVEATVTSSSALPGWSKEELLALVRASEPKPH